LVFSMVLGSISFFQFSFSQERASSYNRYSLSFFYMMKRVLGKKKIGKNLWNLTP